MQNGSGFGGQKACGHGGEGAEHPIDESGPCGDECRADEQERRRAEDRANGAAPEVRLSAQQKVEARPGKESHGEEGDQQEPLGVAHLPDRRQRREEPPVQGTVPAERQEHAEGRQSRQGEPPGGARLPATDREHRHEAGDDPDVDRQEERAAPLEQEAAPPGQGREPGRIPENLRQHGLQEPARLEGPCHSLRRGEAGVTRRQTQELACRHDLGRGQNDAEHEDRGQNTHPREPLAPGGFGGGGWCERQAASEQQKSKGTRRLAGQEDHREADRRDRQPPPSLGLEPTHEREEGDRHPGGCRQDVLQTGEGGRRPGQRQDRRGERRPLPPDADLARQEVSAEGQERELQNDRGGERGVKRQEQEERRDRMQHESVRIGEQRRSSAVIRIPEREGQRAEPLPDADQPRRR